MSCSIKLKGLEHENWSHYKSCAMFLAFPCCSFKCDKECGKPVCQNSELAFSQSITVDIDKIAKQYVENPISTAIVFAGLEPFDSSIELLNAIHIFRNYTKDPIIIYTGYTEEELNNGNIGIAHDLAISIYKKIKEEKVIIKYGRFIPDSISKFDEILGITLASNNQYAVSYMN